MNKQYAEHIAKTNPTRYRMTCDMGGRVLPCSYCANRISKELKCVAFPDGIPKEILIKVDKDRNYECAHGVKYIEKKIV